MTSDPRGHRRARSYRLNIRRQHEAEQRPCCKCRQPIDYQLTHPNPMAWTWEHLDPIADGGPALAPADRLDAAHQRCNSADGARRSANRRRIGTTTKDW